MLSLTSHGKVLLAPLAIAVTASLPTAQDWGPWHLIGPFDHPPGTGDVSTPYGPERELGKMGLGEEGPNLDRGYRGKARDPLGWLDLGLGAGSVDVGPLDFRAYLPPPPGSVGWHDNAVAYLYRKVEVSSDRTLRLAFGSDDGLRMWLNGSLLIDRPAARGLNVFDHQLNLELPAGVSHLLVKVSQGAGGWGFQMAPWQRVSQAAIDQAIERGVAWLLRHRLADGTWSQHPEYGAGYTAWAAYTLLKCGVRKDHPAVRMAVRQIDERSFKTTYSVACALMALGTLGDESRHARLQELLDKLLDWQGPEGLYPYPVHPTGPVLPADLSNTVFVALGLRAAERAGLKVPFKAWRDIVKGTLDCLEAELSARTQTGENARAAGFSYRPGGAATGSMTTAGLTVLALAGESLGGTLPRSLAARALNSQRSSLAWIDHHFDWYANPPNSGHYYFWIYGLERVGVLLDLETLGGVDWYWAGASRLIQLQEPDGSWSEGAPENKEPHKHVDTILALLFLKRASESSTGSNKPLSASWLVEPGGGFELGLRAKGESPTAIWIAELREDVSAELGEEFDVDRATFRARYLDQEGDPVLETSLPPRRITAQQLHQIAARHTLARAGRWALSAELVVRVGDEQRLLSSPELVIPVEGRADEAQLAYATHFANNLLATREVGCSASSHHGDQEAWRVADGSLGTRWHSAVDDPKPWVRLNLQRTARVGRVALGHAWPRPTHRGSPRPNEVLIVVNGSDEFRVRMDPDVMHKTIVEFDREIRVRTLEVRVLDSLDRQLGRDAVGFSEIELLRLGG